jgi:hypothetical protein
MNYFDKLLNNGLLFFTLLFIFTPNISWAYLDPGTGSFIIQVVVATVVGAAVTIKMYWKKLINFFTGKKEEDEEED